METIGVYPLAPLPGRQDSLALQAKNPNFWNDNENPLKRRTIAPENSAYSFEQTRPNHRTRDSDAKYKTKTEDVPVLGLQTVQTGKKKEPCFRTALQKFT